jgi:hypothetical protein
VSVKITQADIESAQEFFNAHEIRRIAVTEGVEKLRERVNQAKCADYGAIESRLVLHAENVMQARLAAFRAYESHPWLRKVFAKLTKDERELCERFLVERKLLSKDKLIYDVNRMFLDREKPKHWTHVMELLTNAICSVEDSV